MLSKQEPIESPNFAIDLGPLHSVITREGQQIAFDASKIAKAIETRCCAKNKQKKLTIMLIESSLEKALSTIILFVVKMNINNEAYPIK